VAHSVVIPVFMNEKSLPQLLERLSWLNERLDGELEAIFVVDGSPDGSYGFLTRALPAQPYRSRLLAHSRNFGSFAAARSGLSRASGEKIGLMAADLQEPPELMLDFFKALDGDADLAVGVRTGRSDRFVSSLLARTFWALYRTLIWRDTPRGGVDVFACTARFARRLTAFREANSSLVTLALWMGFQRIEVPYHRVARRHGKSAWSFRARLRYLTDSVYSFTDLPIRFLFAVGLFGVLASILVATVIGVARLTGGISAPGYTATTFLISFFGALNLLGLGVVGGYLWRTFENTKDRPPAIVMSDQGFDGKSVSR
jgi:glycosyltransferase involved in cell wall biosynthesis